MNRLRSKRMAIFERHIASLALPVRIIDIGGTVQFWNCRGWATRAGVTITVVNIENVPSTFGNIVSRRGNACNLQAYADHSFDIAFSNAVIEHVGNWADQQRMAREVMRVATRYWIQTPNYWFPIEPHFLFPGWQWLPERWRVALIRRHSFGWNGKTPDPIQALRVVRHARLLSKGDLQRLFPDARLMPERLGGLVKSWIAIGGFGPSE
jgi:hypothetical protein